MRATFEPPDDFSRSGHAAPRVVKAMLAIILVLAFAALTALWSRAGGPSGSDGSAMSGPAPKLDSDSSRTLSE